MQTLFHRGYTEKHARNGRGKVFGYKLKSLVESLLAQVVATPSKRNGEERQSIHSLLGIVRRSFDISLWLACCWTRERLASHDGNEENDEDTLVRTTSVVSFDADAHCSKALT